MENSDLDNINSSENNTTEESSNDPENTNDLLKESPFGSLLQVLSENELTSILDSGSSGKLSDSSNSENSNSSEESSNAAENSNSSLKESPFGPLLQFLSEDELASILTGNGSKEASSSNNSASGEMPSGDLPGNSSSDDNGNTASDTDTSSGGMNPFAGGIPFAGGGNTSSGDNTSIGNGNQSAGASNPFAGGGIPFVGGGNASGGSNTSDGANPSGDGNTSGDASNAFTGASNPFAGTSNNSTGSGNPFAGGSDLFTAGGDNPFAGGGDTSTDDATSEGNELAAGDTDLDKLFEQSPWGSLKEVGITSFSQVFGGIDGSNSFPGGENPFTGGGDTSTDGDTPVSGGETSSNGVYTWDFTGLDESKLTDPNNPFNKLLTTLGISTSDSEDSSGDKGDHDSDNKAVSGDDDDTKNAMAQAQEVGFKFTDNPLAEFFPPSDCDDDSSAGDRTFNHLPLPFENPNWIDDISKLGFGEDSKINATNNKVIGNGNWYFACENKTFGNGNWYFNNDNVTIGNGNWHYGSDNATVGSGNWNFGEGNATVGNGNWYLGDNNQILGNGNWISGDNNIVIGSPSSNGKIFTGNDSLIIGNGDWALVVERDEISDELSHQVDDLLNSGLSELQNSEHGEVITAAFIDSFYDQISDDFLNLLSSGNGEFDQSMLTSGTGTGDSNEMKSIYNSSDNLASLGGTQDNANIGSDLASI